MIQLPKWLRLDVMTHRMAPNLKAMEALSYRIRLPVLTCNLNKLQKPQLIDINTYHHTNNWHEHCNEVSIQPGSCENGVFSNNDGCEKKDWGQNHVDTYVEDAGVKGWKFSSIQNTNIIWGGSIKIPRNTKIDFRLGVRVSLTHQMRAPM